MNFVFSLLPYAACIYFRFAPAYTCLNFLVCTCLRMLALCFQFASICCFYLFQICTCLNLLVCTCFAFSLNMLALCLHFAFSLLSCAVCIYFRLIFIPNLVFAFCSVSFWYLHPNSASWYILYSICYFVLPCFAFCVPFSYNFALCSYLKGIQD